jgi:hypothetical protein
MSKLTELVSQEVKDKFDIFWDAELDELDTRYVDAYTITLLAYQKGLIDGWNTHIEENT